MPGRPPSTTRRTALGGLLAGTLALVGCDVDDLRPPADDGGATPTPPQEDMDPDQALVDRVVDDLAEAWLLVMSVRAYPVLRVRLGPLQKLHEAHLDVLGAAPDAPAVPQTGAAAKRYLEVRRVEQRLARRLGEDAVVADSGALARLLASMSAAVAQRLAAMPEAFVAPTTRSAVTEVQGVGALQTTLAAEHAAVYVYGVLGARTSEDAAPGLYAALREAFAAHRARRDDLMGEIAAAGETPVAAANAYAVPAGLDTEAGVNRAALHTERACASTYASLVANTTGPRRRQAVALLTDAAIRGLAFRGTPEIFPGADEYADR